MFGLGTGELLLLLLIVIVLFGAKRIPEIAKSLGASVNAFKSGLKHKEKDKDDKSQD